MKKSSQLFVLILLLFSCKNTQSTQSLKNGSADEAILFSIQTSSCLGPCPVFSFKLSSDSSYYFFGEAHTGIEGALTKKLDDTMYKQLMGLLNSVDWSDLDNEYVSQQSDLPTRNFFYNISQDSISVLQNSLEPKELTELSDNILNFVEENN